MRFLISICRFLKPETSTLPVLLIVQVFSVFTFLAPLLAQNIPAPVIQCVSTDQNTGDVYINWLPYTPHPCGSFAEFQIFGATNIAGPYTLINTVPITNVNATSYTHVGANGTILNWYYRMVAVHNCPGVTADTSAPQAGEILDIPQMDYVTVLPDGSVQVVWKPSASAQVAGYIVYYVLGGGLFSAIDTVLGINNTTYVDINANTGSGSIIYSVAAFDYCGNRTLINPNGHNTIFLTQSASVCAATIDLRWNLYRNWPSGTQYQIESTIDNGTPVIAYTLPDSSTGYNFPVTQLNGDSVCFRVAAVHTGGSPQSFSNKVCMAISFIRSTAFNFLRNITVNASGGVDLNWIIDTTAHLNAFLINRSLPNASFVLIDSVTVTAPVAFQNYYTDASAPTIAIPLTYRIDSRDDCGLVRASTIGKTILLEASFSGNMDVSLQWNSFELEYATVLNYTINRIINNTRTPVQTVGPAELSFQESIANAVSDAGQFCYQIEAEYMLELPGFNTENLKSYSNIRCIEQEPVVYVASALVPEGKNKSVRPVLLVPNVKEYEFQVFDRWGKVMFATTELTAGWDGTNKGERLPFGTYVYRVRLVTQQGKELIQKGTITLVR
jgi:gliding motility-associated-like protein